MNHDISAAAHRRPLLTLIAGACLALSLQGCIDRDHADDGSGSTTGGATTGGETTGGDTTPGACANLPAATTNYKGGDALGEELTLSLDPATLAYTITLDASVQRTAGTQLTGTLTQLDGCTYTSEEAGAQFTLSADGVVEGGVKTPAGTSFAPLLAFASTYNNSADPTKFNDIAFIFNAVGAQSDGTTTSAYAGAGRLRNAGTLQFCVDDAAGFMVYDAACTNTAKGYISYNADRNAYDYFATDPAGSAVTTGGTLAGSFIIGQVGAAIVPLQLVRESATSYGMRLLTAQGTLASGSADGSYAVVDSSGSNASATIAGSAFTRANASGTLSYDTPVVGIVEASGALAGHLIYAGGVYGFVPSASGGAMFELGVAN
jgi:feruloyl esterase